MEDAADQLWSAAQAGDVERVRRLLATAPNPAAHVAAGADLAGLHEAVHRGAEARFVKALRLLLSVDPSLAMAKGLHGSTLLRLAATCGNFEAVRLLLATAPSASQLAATGDRYGVVPLHIAAAAGRDDIVRLLLQAVPGSAAAVDNGGHSPLDWALWHVSSGQMHEAHLRSARLLLAAPGQQPGSLLRSLNRVGRAAQPLYVAVATHYPLTAAEWQLMPSPCPGLSAALLTVLQRSPAEAALLVAHLHAHTRLRLRTAALAIHRTELVAGVVLPQPLVWRILATGLA